MIAGFAKVIGRMCIHAGTGCGCCRTSFRNARSSHLPPRSDPGNAGAMRALSRFVPLSGRGHWCGSRLGNAYGMVAMVTLAALLSTGCVLSSRSPTVPQGSQAQGYGQQSQKGLIKPYIPGSPGAPDASRQTGLGEATDLRPQSATKGERTNPGVPAQAGSLPPASNGTSQGRNQWESQKVKAAAIKMAKTIPSIVKIKVCYAVENDEWWVTLYDDHGPLIDLKQFTWNREKLDLEPFLVLRQISKGQLEHDLTQKTSGRACEILDYPSSR